MNWRLVGSLEVYLLTKSREKREIYLACPEKKKYKAVVQKKIKDEPYRVIYIEDNEFKLRFGPELEFQIKSPELPEPNEWYTVMNGTDESLLLGNILRASDYVGGEFKETNWEAIFDGKESDTVSFVNPKMEEYAEYFSELRRRLSCETLTKTKKWIPGHRYDSVDETIIYLGSVEGRLFNSKLLSTPQPLLAYISLLKDEKTIEDVFENRVIGTGKYDIKFIDKEKLMVDSGEVLSVGEKMPSIYSQLPRMVECLKQRYLNKNDIKTYQASIFNVITPFFYKTESDDDLMITNAIKEKVIDVVKTIEKSIYISCWNTNASSYKINSEQSDLENIESIKRLFAQVTSSYCHDSRYETWGEIFNNIVRIDWTNITKEVMESWKESEVFESLEKYIENSAYFTYHDSEIYHRVLDQRDKSKLYYYGSSRKTEITSLDTLYPEELCDVLKDIIIKGEEEYGNGLKKFKVLNNGTKSKPLYYVDAIISVDDIVKYFSGNVPKEIEKQIIQSKFWELTVLYDQGDKLK